MKQYDRFGEYMFDLLFGPLKKGKRAINQFYIFFKVIGRVFDGLKKDALRVRDETNIATASPIMLPVHGQDRNMPRLAGESIEGYRTRLAMKGIIAEKAGIKEGMCYALAALGYEQSTIKSFAYQDPERWAEFTVDLGPGNPNAVRDVLKICNELEAVKEASSKLAEIIITSPAIYGRIPIHLTHGPRQGQAAPPVFRPGGITTAIYVTPRIRWNFSTVTLPMAAPQEGG